MSMWNDYVASVKEEKDLIEAEARLFIHCVCDENELPIFNEDDLSELLEAYGNKHSRILEEGLKLLTIDKNPVGVSEKKS